MEAVMSIIESNENRLIRQQKAEKMVKENILPFWQNMADNENGGFYGEADFFGKINKNADKGCILNSRILWTFSAAYRLFKDNIYKEYAAHAKDFLYAAFLDKEYGGLYWLVDHKGSCANTRKQFYNIAFGIYALSEHYLATGDQSSLDLALSLFDVTEKYGLDPVSGGYIEARIRNWQDIDDYRLSGKDLNSPKSMNTNLHVLEAYTALSAASAQARVRNALETLVQLTLEKIVNRNHNFELFFDMEWNSLSKEISYGHDIEGSWLMYEAALAVGSESLVSQVKKAALNIAEVTFNTAIDNKNGGLFGGCDEKRNIIPRKEWWPQAEAVVGFYNAYELSGETKYLNASENIWEYIKNHFTDSTNGEWYNELSMDNTPDTKMPKAGFWKCPYHNARCCFEIIKRSQAVSGKYS
jgi:mannobiose 2-epimerase